jgi:hypothetical protein
VRCTLRRDGNLLSPECRNRAFVILKQPNWASERLTRRVVGPQRSTQRHLVKVVDLEKSKLWHRLREIAADDMRWGCRMAYRLLRGEGWSLNQ